MARISFVAWLYFGLIISLAALSYPFITLSIVNGQLETPLPLPSINRNYSEPPIFTPRPPTTSQLQSEAQNLPQNQSQALDRATVLNSNLSDPRLDLSNFLRNYSSRVESCN